MIWKKVVLPDVINSSMREFIALLESKKEDLVTPTLEYSAGDLDPVLSKETIDYHFGKLAKGYAKRYNAGEGDEKFNKNGHLLHAIYFPQFKKPRGANRPTGQVAEFIDRKFGSYEDLKEKMKEEAMKIQGSGWIFVNNNGDIETIKNHELTGDSKRVIILIDWWEHAWALDYQSDKAKYLENMWKIIDWDKVNIRLS